MRKFDIFTLLIAVCLFPILLVSLQPATLHQVSTGLDPSWTAVSAHSLTQGLAFGRDIVFTTGPYASIYTKMFVGDFTLAIVALVVAIAGFLAVSVALSVRVAIADLRPALAGFFLLTTCIVLKNAYVDGLYLLVPVATALLSMRGWVRWPVIVVGVILSAALGLTKFSIYPFAVAAFILADILLIYRKEWPYNTVVYFVASILLFWLSGQDWTQYTSFVAAGLDITAGYSAAMAVNGRWAELAIWIAMAGAVVLITALDEFRRARTEGTWVPGSIRVVLLGGLLFTGMKAGFVRHDAHSLIAWGVLGLAAIVFSAPEAGGRWFRWKIALIGSIALTTVLPWIPVGLAGANQLFDPAAITRSAIGQVSELGAIALEPRTWLDQRTADWNARNQVLAEQAALPRIDGTVDIIPSSQSDVIASGLDYRPRPSFQEYGTYTKGLIDRNRDFFEGEKAPDYLFFAPGSIDSRHPASAEGALWPIFLSRYEAADSTRGMLVLKKRESPIENLLLAPIVAEVSMGETFALPQSDNPLFVKLDISKTLIGRFLTFLLKPPQVHLVVQYADKTEDRYRVIPAMAREGMILSPTVQSALDYWLVETGTETPNFVRRPVSFRIETGMTGRLAYSAKTTVEVSEVDHLLLAANYSGLTRLDDALGQFRGLSTVAQKNGLNPPFVDITPDGLFAHAANTLLVETGPHSHLKLQFAMSPGNYQSFSDSDGVCFSAQVSGSDHLLFERCLDPRSDPSDLKLQTVELEVPSSETIELRTTCRSNCAYDWSYWARIDLF